MSDYERLGAFYLGRVVDPASGETRPEPLLYESKDLTTHALCVGMTGSGKTGLCCALLEEAALDGIPAIAVDPKGDLGNLLLAFPELRAEDFRPWIDPAEAARAGQTPDAFAADTARRWREGLAAWDQDGARVRRFCESAERAIYTPGSQAGRPLRVLSSLAAPSPQLRADADALRDRVEAAVGGLLALLGIDADPLRSREHILLANLVLRAWQEGRDLALGELIQAVQSPPFERLGVLELESFFPAKERFELALRINHLLASPGFGAWLEGDPLDVGALLVAPDGRPRLSVISLAHLSDPERMFFVSILLSEVLSWMRAQPGTSSLRAILYMDEIFGFFPPSANPPSKQPMLTLLKQARAFGLGVVLSTQNPVDLDYKGLANTGTWLLGRLQTERDKARVLDGLEGAATAAGTAFDRTGLDALLSGLRSRRFLLHNVHDDRPELFESRWALSYLRGPLTREQIRQLAGEKPAPAAAAPAPTPARTRAAPAGPAASDVRPVLPPEIPQRVLAPQRPAPAGAQLVYRPALLARARLRYADAKLGLEHAEALDLLAPLGQEPRDPWEAAEPLAAAPATQGEPVTGARFAPLPAAAARPQSYAAWRKSLAAQLARTRRLELFRAPALDRVSRPGESEAAFRAGLVHTAREQRDLALERLREAWAPRLARLAERIRAAEERLSLEQDQRRQQTLQTAVSVGATVLGALFGRKLGSAGNLGRATSAARGAGRVARESQEVQRAAERAEDLRGELAELESRFAQETAALRERLDPQAAAMERLALAPRKSDLAVEDVALAWLPCWQTPGGVETRAL